MNPDLAYDYESTPVGDLAAFLPGAAALLRAEGVGFCCHPERTLTDAAARRGLEGRRIAVGLAELSRAGVAAPDPTPDLIDHILATYHEGHRRDLDALIPLGRAVETEHADHPDTPAGLADLLAGLRVELEDHMFKEEARLFPMMRQGGGTLIAGPVAQMRDEHAAQREALMALEHLTCGFRAPDDADAAWRTLCEGARIFAASLVEHMWLENEVLFPRFEGRPAPAFA
jgi:regulator of cell morphogenesis and NO signaling